jgi:hypothetical protein
MAFCTRSTPGVARRRSWPTPSWPSRHPAKRPRLAACSGQCDKRAFVTIGAVELFWVATAWPNGAATIVFVAHASLSARLDRLAPAREVAQIGAAVGRQFSHELISAVAGMPQPHIDDALEQLVRAVKEKAVGYWLKAGQQAIAHSAMTEAIAQLQKGLGALADVPDGPWRRQQELDLQIALRPALAATKGYSAVDVGKTLARARTLAEQIDRPEYLVPLLYGQWAFHLVRYRAQAGAITCRPDGKARRSAKRRRSAVAGSPRVRTDPLLPRRVQSLPITRRQSSNDGGRLALAAPGRFSVYLFIELLRYKLRALRLGYCCWFCRERLLRSAAVIFAPVIVGRPGFVTCVT